jgi:hypothetical protein
VLTRAAVCLWMLYLVVPVAGWGVFAGRPLGLLSTIALCAVCWLGFARSESYVVPTFRRISHGPVEAGRHVPRLFVSAALAALLLKIALGTTLLIPRGFDARYYANATFSGPIESSTESPAAGVTRIDHRLAFGVGSAPDLPLAFVNELRFNYYRDTDPDRATLPFAVRWQGMWRVTRGGTERLYAHTPGGAVAMTIGDSFSTRIDASDTWTGEINLPAGLHRVSIEWSVPQGGARRFEAGRIVDGREVPFGDSAIVRRRAGATAWAADAMVRAVSRTIDALLLAWLMLQVARAAAAAWANLRLAYNPRDAVALTWLVGIVDALVFALPSFARMIILSGGDDWLTYESEARDIALHGLWMNEGAALGHGAAFYGQPLYSYFLAACHWLFGDGLFGIYLVQRLLVAATVIALWRTAALLFDEGIGAAALITAVVVAYEKLAAWSNVLLTETLFTPLVCAWVYLLIRLGLRADRQRRLAILTGLIGGLATLARSSLLLGWVIVVAALAMAIPRQRPRLTVIALCVSTMLAVSSLATLRNWVVAHQFVLISSEGPIVLFLGNSPPPLETPQSYKAQYERLGLDSRVQAVVEYARQQPRSFARGLWRKARFTLGWFEELLPGSGTSWFYVALWMSALAGAALLWRIRPASLALATIPPLLALSHFAAVVLFQPHVYGDRLIMPLYVLLVPLVALPVAAIASAGIRWGRDRTASALCALLLLAAIGRIIGWLVAIDVDVLAVATLLAGIALVGLPGTRSPWIAPYAIYAVALGVWFVRAPSLQAEATVRNEYLFIAVALVSPAFLRSRGGQATLGALIVGLAAIGAALLARHGIPPGTVSDMTKSLRNLYGYTAALAAPAGLLAGAATLLAPARLIGVRQTLLYSAAAAMTLPALQWAGAMINPQRAVLNNQLSTIGAIGACAYVAIWIHSAWPVGGDLSSRAWRGIALGVFATAAFGAGIGHAAAALAVVAGLVVGLIQADRARLRIG